MSIKELKENLKRHEQGEDVSPVPLQELADDLRLIADELAVCTAGQPEGCEACAAGRRRVMEAAIAADLIVLAIGVVAAYFKIPYALQIITAALAALGPLIHGVLLHATARRVDPPKPDNIPAKRHSRTGRQKAR